MPFPNASYNVLTAYDNATRTFYVATCQTAGSATLFGAVLNGSVSGASLATKSTFMFPNSFDVLVRIHVVTGNTKGSLLALFANGNAVLINPTTGATSLLANLLTGVPQLKGGQIMLPSAVDTLVSPGVVYTLASDETTLNIYLLSVNVATGNTTAVAIRFLREHWGEEVLFHAVFIPERNGLVVFAKAVDPQHGFDQLLFVSVTGATEFLIGNLLETGNYGFNINSQVKEDDTYQTGTYDPSTQKLYFQASVYAGDDDGDRTTALVYAYLGKVGLPYVDVVCEPMNIGYMGMYYVTDAA